MPDLPHRTDRAVPQGCIARVRANSGFTLLETMLVIVIASLVMTTVLQGQHLIHSARMHNLISQQVAAESAFLAFQDRFRAPPGDYAEASANIDCTGAPCLNGNGNGRIEAGSGSALHEEILAWQHLTAAGFIQGEFHMLDATVAVPSPDNAPQRVW
jgi:prepilin-type N-terminal cleavage/methylation domain-containing protein